MRLRTTFEQWVTLLEVDRAGSIQAAAKTLNKSHTTLIYAIKKLEDQLGVSLVTVKGRRAVLTDNGQSLLRRASAILDQAHDLEAIGSQLAKGMEGEITVSVDHLCDRQWVYQPLSLFVKGNKGTSIEIIETSLSASTQAVIEQQVDIAIIPLPIANYLAEVFGQVNMTPIVSCNHHLAAKKDICSEDLQTTTQIVVRDLGENQFQEEQNVGWLKSQQRLTVDNFDHALQAVKEGIGFCRIPDHIIKKQKDKELVKLSVLGGTTYQVPLHVTLPKAGATGPAAMAFYNLLIKEAQKRMN